MNISVTFFARARDLAAVSRVELQLPEKSTVADLRGCLAERFEALRPLLPRLLIAVGTDYANDNLVLSNGADVACFPPVSGG